MDVSLAIQAHIYTNKHVFQHVPLTQSEYLSMVSYNARLAMEIVLPAAPLIIPHVFHVIIIIT